MTMKNDSKFEEDLTGQFKIDFQILTRAIKNVKNLLFNGLLLRKYIMFELSNYRGVMFADTQDWCKIWRKTDLCFQKWHEEFGKFSPEHISKV